MDHCRYSQLATYLQCPLKYKYHYLEGWEERTEKASMTFGKVFETAVESQFLVEDSVQFFTQRWTSLGMPSWSTPVPTRGTRCLNRVRNCLSSFGKTSGLLSKMDARIFRSDFAAGSRSVG